MKKSFFRIVSIYLALSVLFCSTAFAGEYDSVVATTGRMSEAVVTAEEGEIFASLTARVSNIGDGGIGVFAQALMYQDVPWIELSITLQRYEQRGSSFGWYNVDPEPIVEEYYDTHAGVYDNVLYGYPTGYDYRVRVVMKIDSVTKITTTDGVRITGP